MLRPFMNRPQCLAGSCEALTVYAAELLLDLKKADQGRAERDFPGVYIGKLPPRKSEHEIFI